MINWTRNRWRTGCLLLVAGVITLFSPPSQAKFSAPFDLSASGQSALDGNVAVNSKGKAVAVWVRSDGTNFRVQTRMRSAAGVLGPVQTLSISGHNATLPRAAINDAGDVAFIWQLYDGSQYGIQGRTRSAGGVIGPVLSLAPSAGAGGGGLPDTRLAIGADGRVIFVWGGGTVQARIVTSSGVLGPLLAVSTASQADLPSVAIDGNGNATFVWLILNTRVETRVLSSAGAFRAIKTLSASGDQPFADPPQVAVDATGAAAFTWNIFDGAHTLVQVRNRTPSGQLGALRRPTQPGRDARNPQISVDGNGNAAAIWSRIDPAGYLRVQLTTLSASSVLGATHTVSQAGQNAFNAQIAVDPAGDGMLVWMRSDGVNERIQAAPLSAAGALGATQTISNVAENGYEPQVGIAKSGKALAVWRNGTTFRIQGAGEP